MQRWLPRTDLMLDRIPSASQRAIVPYLWLAALLLVLHAGFVALAALPIDDTGGLAVLERTAAIWRQPIAYLALAIAWLSAGCALAAVVDSQPRRHLPYLIVAALVPPVVLARQAGSLALGHDRTRAMYAYGWPLRFAGLAIPFAALALFVEEAAAAAAANLAIGLLLYTIRSIKPALRWPRRRVVIAIAVLQVGLALVVAGAMIGFGALAGAGGVVTAAGGIALCSTLAAITAERSTRGESLVDAPARRLAWHPARSTR